MPYKVCKLQNSSDFPGNPKPTIQISENDPEWKPAYFNWLKGQPPTDSPEWRKGISAITRPFSGAELMREALRKLWYEWRKTIIFAGTPIIATLIFGFAISAFWGIIAGLASLWFLAILAALPEGLDDFAAKRAAIPSQFNVLNTPEIRMYKHPRNPDCPCWKCARENNPDFINDPANGQYKFWKDVPTTLIIPPLCDKCA